MTPCRRSGVADAVRTAERRLAAAVLWLGLAGLAAAGLAVAQEPPVATPFVDSVDVEVVNVDVVVTDRSGRPVGDLAREDFELFEDGRRVEVAYFSAARSEPLVAAERLTLEGGEAPPPAEASPRRPLHLVIYVDNAFVTAASRNRLFASLLEFLEPRLAAGDRAMVASFNGGIRVEQEFTSDPADLRSTLDRMTETAPFGERAAIARRQILEEMLQLADLTGTCDEAAALARSHVASVYSNVQASVSALTRFVDTLAGLPGRKALLHVSDGLPVVAGADVFLFLETACAGGGASEGLASAGIATGSRGRAGGGGGGGGSAGTGFLDAQAYSSVDDLRELTRRANANRVSFFTLDAAGPRTPPAASAAVADRRAASQRVAFEARANLQDSLHLLADETGGRSILDTIDFTDALTRLGTDFDSSYSLGYTPAGRRERETHRLEVKVRRPGLSVRHRKSFEVRSTGRKMSDRTFGALVYGAEENPLEVVAAVGERQRQDGTGGAASLVPIELSIPFRNLVLVPVEDRFVGRLALRIAVRSADGSMTPVREVTVPLQVPAARIEEAMAASFRYRVELALGSGEQAVAFGLSDEQGGQASFIRIRVPDDPR